MVSKHTCVYPFLQCLLGKPLKNSVYVGSWPCDLAYSRCPPGLDPKSVFAHQSVRKREKKKQRVSLHAHSLLLAPFIFSGTHQTCLMAVVDTVPLVVATISKLQELVSPSDLWVSRRYRAPWDVRKAFTFFLGFVVDVWCTVPQGSLCAGWMNPSDNCILGLMIFVCFVDFKAEFWNFWELKKQNKTKEIQMGSK